MPDIGSHLFVSNPKPDGGRSPVRSRQGSMGSGDIELFGDIGGAPDRIEPNKGMVRSTVRECVACGCDVLLMSTYCNSSSTAVCRDCAVF